MSKIFFSLIFFVIASFSILLLPAASAAIPPLRYNEKEEVGSPSLSTTMRESAIKFLNKKAVTVPIILYHHIRPITPTMEPLARGLSVTPDVFDQQLEYFEKNGYATITLEQMYEALKEGKKIVPRTIIFSFDDGYADNYQYAFPILQKHHFGGILFLITNAVGTPDYLSWDQIKEMKKSDVFEIGSHTLNHPVLPALSMGKMQKEVRESKKVLEEHIGAPVDFFCYPYGKYTKEIILAVKDAGYKGAVTTHYGTTHTFASLFETSRVRLTNDDVAQTIEKKVKLFLK